ncbi:hypothetical protein N7456_003547 [Penicillium angulare]|uniref:Uncharacterized protein n=1 Tax=Penicillium angulare TaxID=116970 RepID=A0A9W9FV05_9EURO|nr:hypothetical protein N7456_003547 [Penicillium angulare]
MGKGLARLIGSGIGFTSEAIHAARHRNKDTDPASDSAEHRSLSSSGLGPSATSTRNLPIRNEPAELSNDAEGGRELRGSGTESLPPYSPGESGQDRGVESERGFANAENTEFNPDSEEGASEPSREEIERGLNADEAAWQLDEATEEFGLPAYDAPESGARESNENDSQEINKDDTEDEKAKKRELMVQALAKMAGPPGPKRKLPLPVIIPQRRPGAKKRGFVRAYAPMLADCGIGQDVFLKFISDFHKASQASMWLQIIVVGANITGWTTPSLTATAIAVAIQIVADTAQQLQIRHRQNSYLDRVNQEIFMPRGQYAMIMKFSDKPAKPGKDGQKDQSSGTLAERFGGLISTEQVDFNNSAAKLQTLPPSEQLAEGQRPEFDAAATISKFTHSEEHPDMNKFQQRMKHYRLYSGQTKGELELPESAPLIFPDVDRAAIRVRDGLEPKSKFQESRTWARDYIDRKSQGEFESEHKGSALAVPETARKGFNSRYNDPNHPANNGKLLSALTGGVYNPKPSMIERATAAYKERDDKKRAAKGLPPAEPWKDKLRRKKKEQGARFRIAGEDVMYLMIVNMPTQEELKETVAHLQYLVEEQQREAGKSQS